VSSSLDNIKEKLNNKYGGNTIVTGGMSSYNPVRLPFNVFSVDFAIGGGIPIHASTCLWGNKGCGKTTLAIKAMAWAAKICWRCFNPLSLCDCSAPALKMKTVWCDVEGTLDPNWVAAQGVSSSDYELALADYGEQYIDVAEAVMTADDCGMVVIDSLAMLTPLAEIENPTEKTNMGKQPQMLTRAVRKLKQQLIRERKNGHPCTLLFTNHMRQDLNKKFGSTDSIPGGNAAMHEYSLLLRCGKRSLDATKDKKYIDEGREINRASRHIVTVREKKITVFRGGGEYVLIQEDIPELKLKKGDIDDYSVTIAYGRAGEIIKKGSTKYSIGKDEFQTISAIQEKCKEDPIFYFNLKKAIIEKEKDKS
jgi:recombination protein RecA